MVIIATSRHIVFSRPCTGALLRTLRRAVLPRQQFVLPLAVLIVLASYSTELTDGVSQTVSVNSSISGVRQIFRSIDMTAAAIHFIAFRRHLIIRLSANQ